MAKGRRIGSDIDKDTINALKLIRDNLNLIPKNNKEFTEEDYHKVKNDPDHPLHGYIAFAASYASKKWGGWARNNANTDYIAAAYRNAVKQSPKLQGVKLVCAPYDELDIPARSIIYCDPPYANTTKYTSNINHEEFWDWCRYKAQEGHDIFISEYNAPEDFKCVWEKTSHTTIHHKNSKSTKRVEKLFIYEG